MSLPQRSDHSSPNGSSWKNALRDAVTDVGELLAMLELSRAELPALIEDERFPLRVPREFVAKMKPGDPRDPLLLQVLPIEAEGQASPGYSSDPLRETGLITPGGLLTKYEGRDLLVTTGACPVHCRYCFRRHFPYQASMKGADLTQISERLALRKTPELILSGGDPLSLSNSRLSRLVDAVAKVSTLKRLRIHTRFPVVLPSRIDDGLLELLPSKSLKVIVVFHSNHPAELDQTVELAARRLLDRDVLLLNQAVLLRGVNDNPDVQIELAERLFQIGVMPYYLHVLDPVAGSAHFAVNDEAGIEIHAQAAARLPGYLTPKLVREIPGKPGKTLLT